MRPARPWSLVLLGVLVTGLAWSLLKLWTSRGAGPLPLPWTAAAGVFLLAGGVVLAGLPVRRWVRGRRDRPVNPLMAARIVVLAQAAAYSGAVLTGWYLAQGLALLPDLVGTRRSRFVVALVAAAGAVLLAMAGLVVQRWCRVPPQDRGPSEGERPEGDPPPS